MALNKKRRAGSQNMHETPFYVFLEEITPMDWRRWEEVDVDILAKIFCKIPGPDLFSNVYSVCRSWRLAFSHALFWRHNILDLTPALKAFSDFKYRLQKSISLRFHSSELDMLLRKIMEGNDAYGDSLEHWTKSINTLVIPKGLGVTDKHLQYIVQRTPNLQSIIFKGSFEITENGFTANCSELNSLPGICTLKMKTSITFELVRSLQTVKSLVFEGVELYRKGMSLILEQRLFDVEKIHLVNCSLKETYSPLPGNITAIIRFDRKKIGLPWSFEGSEKDVNISSLQKQFTQWKDEPRIVFHDLDDFLVFPGVFPDEDYFDDLLGVFPG